MSTAVKEDFMRDRMKRMMALAVLLLAAVVLAAGCGGEDDGDSLEEIQIRTDEQVQADRDADLEEPHNLEEDSEIREEVSKEAGKSEEKIYVFVCGEVAAPGVYELAADSRIYQAIEAAGGLSESAAGDYVNQAELVADGQRIYIPSSEEVQAGSPGILDSGGNAAGQPASDGRVNLNTAGKEELMTLTGIGEKKAEAIIQYRDVSGGFGSIEELMQVEGIKEGTFEKIKEDIVI